MCKLFVPGFKRNLFTLFVKGISAHQVTGFSQSSVLNFDGFNPTYPETPSMSIDVCIHMCYNSTSSHSTRILSPIEFWIGCPRFLTYLTKHAQEYQTLDHVADLNLWSSVEHFFNLLEWTIPLNWSIGASSTSSHSSPGICKCVGIVTFHTTATKNLLEGAQLVRFQQHQVIFYGNGGQHPSALESNKCLLTTRSISNCINSSHNRMDHEYM